MGKADGSKVLQLTDGIMLEVHPDPKNSAVDPLQPIDYKEFGV